MANIAVMGFGTVGSGVYEVIKRNSEIISKRLGQELTIKYVLDLRDFEGQPVQDIITHDVNDILNDDSIEVVVEVMGGINPAYKFVKEALLKGKSVATSNKALVAAHGAELLQIARNNNVNFLFEASVGGGIPILRPLSRCITADNILEVTGILNGTTNYILTEMEQKGSAFEEVLKEAQALGYAEKDPTADIEGYDACRKIAILSSLAFGKNVNYEEIYTEGITTITALDIAYANKMDCTIKLVGTSKSYDTGVFAMVAPMLLKKSHPLAAVNGVFNAIFVKGNVLGDTMFFGSGAGSLPTASAVVSDVIDAIKHTGKNVYVEWSAENLVILDKKNVPVKAFIRVSSEASKQALTLFQGAQQIVLEDVENEIGILTGMETEGTLQEKIELLRKGAEVFHVIRVNE